MVRLLLFALPGCKVDPTPLPPALGIPATLEEGGVRTCALVGDRDALGPFERRTAPTPLPSDPWTWHGGITAADLDNDGILDILAALEQGVELYQGLPEGGFLARGAVVFAGIDLTFASGATAVDYDADGDLDVYVTRVLGFPAPEGGTLGENRLLQNRGNGTFDDVTDEAGVNGCGVDHRDGSERCFRSMASSWGDIDLDGDLDLYVGNYGFVDETPGTTQEDMEPAERDFLYRNDGGGTFTDISDMIADEVHEGYTYAGGFVDLDADGDLDLYTVNDFGNQWPNRVMWNENGTLVFDPNEASGLVRRGTGMGMGVGDLNGDGRPDIAIPEWKGNGLLESRAETGIWVDTAELRGFTLDFGKGQHVGWGTIMADIDNDGHLDLVSQYGHLESENAVVWKNAERQPDAIYHYEPSGEDFDFVDVASAWGAADTGMSRGVVAADLNGDGWLDLGKRFLDGNNVTYLSRCGQSGWLVVALAQPGTQNLDAVGARVEVTAGGRTQSRHIIAGGVGYGSSPPLVAHFGLGDVDTVEAIRVVWPDGGQSTLAGTSARQRVVITRTP